METLIILKTIKVCFYILVIHTIADFLLQTEEMAVNKSKSNGALLSHVMAYSFTWFLGSAPLFWSDCDISFLGKCVDTPKIFAFVGITFVSHFITDYISSRISKNKFEKKEYYTGIPNFGAFTVIQIDQLAHYAQLFLTYYYLTT